VTGSDEERGIARLQPISPFEPPRSAALRAASIASSTAACPASAPNSRYASNF
jgi:hypothetical protein